MCDGLRRVSKISAGCKYCYAEVMARRLQAMGIEKYQNGFDLAIHESALDIPYTWKSPKIEFVNSMSDLFFHNTARYFHAGKCGWDHKENRGKCSLVAGSTVVCQC